MTAAERVRRFRDQEATLEQREQARDERAVVRFLEKSGGPETRMALHSIEIEEQRELQELIAEQEADDTYVVSPELGGISLDAFVAGGSGEVGTVADFVGCTADGSIVNHLPRRRGGDPSSIPTRDRPGRPQSKPLAPLARWTIECRIDAGITAALKANPCMSPRAARALAIGQLDPRPTLNALKQATAPESESNLKRWRRENGRKTLRGVEADYRRAAAHASGRYPGGIEGVKHEIRNIGAGVAVAWPFPRAHAQITPGPKRTKRDDSDPVPNPDRAPAPARVQGRRDRGAPPVRVPDGA